MQFLSLFTQDAPFDNFDIFTKSSFENWRLKVIQKHLWVTYFKNCTKNADL